MKYKTFIVDEKMVALIMEILINQRYYVIDKEDGTKRYIFQYCDGIERAYGKAKTMMNLCNE